MKTMTCNQLGGACDIEFHASTFEEIAEMSKAHAREMFQMGDKDHLEAMNNMQDLMKNSDAMNKWFKNKRKEFSSLPESE